MSKTRYGNNRFRIVSIDMKNRCLHHFCDFRTVNGRAGIQYAAGRESDLIVDDYVDGSANLEAASMRHVQGFHYDTLTGKGCVTMYKNWSHLVFGFIASTMLPRPHRTFNNRIDNFKM